MGQSSKVVSWRSKKAQDTCNGQLTHLATIPMDFFLQISVWRLKNLAQVCPNSCDVLSSGSTDAWTSAALEDQVTNRHFSLPGCHFSSLLFILLELVYCWCAVYKAPLFIWSFGEGWVSYEGVWVSIPPVFILGEVQNWKAPVFWLWRGSNPSWWKCHEQLILKQGLSKHLCFTALIPF